MSKLINLAGAPVSSELGWKAEDLLEHLVTPFADSRALASRLPRPERDPERLQPSWRRISLQDSRRRGSGSTPDATIAAAAAAGPDDCHEPPSRPCPDHRGHTRDEACPLHPPQDSGKEDKSPQIEATFPYACYSHSLQHHEGTQGSTATETLPVAVDQVLHAPALTSTSLFTTGTTAAATAATSTTDSQPTGETASALGLILLSPQIPPGLRVTDLRCLPIPARVKSLYPGTLSLNLIVCVLSLPARPKALVTRYDEPKELVELLVGDETRSGLAVNLWLDPGDGAASEARVSSTSELRRQLEAVEERDVVLLRNVGVAVWRDAVCAQSLRGGGGGRRGRTSVQVLFRAGDRAAGLGRTAMHGEGEEDAGGVVEKVRRVREWVRDFVGFKADDGEPGSDDKICGRRGVKRKWLPPDTQ